MIRLFTGIEIPDEIRARLAALAAGVPGARWVPAANIHLTLRFIGNVDDDRVGDIDDALARVRAPGFPVTIQGVDHFSRGRSPSMLWAGVEKNPALLHLQDRVETALVRAGLESDRRKYTPHVTLARLKDAPRGRVHAFIAENGLLQFAPFTVENFTLFSSFLARSGAIHRREAVYPLGVPEP
ncbi:MAG TPA: RNA 2',3'-cyclic phosphodiesterase [Alphaproteobacteria bacterium]